MNRDNSSIQPLTFRSFLEQLATYISILSPVISAILVSRGLSENRIYFYISASIPVILGFIWLRFQYLLAKNQIKTSGLLQRPAWFWKFITNKIPHKNEQLQESQVMVFVPPQQDSYAAILEKEYNENGGHLLLFHYIPGSSDGEIDEEKGRVTLNGMIRPLETLAEEMNECAALVLLDDTKWTERYVRTLNVVEEWTKRYTTRPVMSVHLEGRGTLNYSWSRFENLVKPNHSLKNRLLAQSTNRGAKWFWQARLYRRMILLTFSIALLIFAYSLYTVYIAQNDVLVSNKTVDNLESKVGTLEKSTASDPTTQQEISRAFNYFRANPSIPESERFHQLLRVHADQLRGTLAKASGNIDAISGNVILFSVKNIKEDTEWEIKEVLGTRIPPNNKEFNLKISHDKTSDIEGVVSCAVAMHAFVLWSGWEGKTEEMKAWSLKGRLIGMFDQETLKYDKFSCRYQKRSTEDLHKQLLCAPVGQDPNSDDTNPAGAICISYANPMGFLEEEWTRQTIARYGTSLSFVFWNQILSDTTKKRPSA